MTEPQSFSFLEYKLRARVAGVLVCDLVYWPTLPNNFNACHAGGYNWKKGLLTAREKMAQMVDGETWTWSVLFPDTSRWSFTF